MLTQGKGMNKFAPQAPVMIIISEEPYVPSAALGAKIKGNDYRSIDIGILSAYITAEAASQGLGSCIIGWLDDGKIREICGTDGKTSLVVALGYPSKNDILRQKKRKSCDELVTVIED